MMSEQQQPETMEMADDATKEAAIRRLRGFAMHMAAFVFVSIILGIINFATAPGEWWFVYPMVLWGAPLALHAAFGMGLFRGFR